MPTEPDASLPLPIFVYGTLKQGECRERCWPFPPVRIEPGTIRGRLRDLGPYPALVAGDEVVRGELWTIAPEQLAETLRVLDEIEGIVDGSDDMYERIVVDVRLDDGRVVPAYVYRYLRPERIAEYPVAPAGEAGWCEWWGEETGVRRQETGDRKGR